MTHDDTDFDRLLKETREWEARDRARHKSIGMKDGDGAEPFPAGPRAPTVTVEELERKTAADLKPIREPPPGAETPKPATAIKIALRAVKQAQAHRPADRARSKGGWGWIWALILLYFIIKHFTR